MNVDLSCKYHLDHRGVLSYKASTTRISLENVFIENSENVLTELCFSKVAVKDVNIA